MNVASVFVDFLYPWISTLFTNVHLIMIYRKITPVLLWFSTLCWGIYQTKIKLEAFQHEKKKRKKNYNCNFIKIHIQHIIFVVLLVTWPLGFSAVSSCPTGASLSSGKWQSCILSKVFRSCRFSFNDMHFYLFCHNINV